MHPTRQLLYALLAALCSLHVGCSNLDDVSGVDYIEASGTSDGTRDAGGTSSTTGGATTTTGGTATTGGATGATTGGTTATTGGTTGATTGATTGPDCVPTGPDICDGQDNDCDGMIDEASDALLSECPDVVNGSSICTDTGECDVRCEPDFVDANDDLTDGCECTPTEDDTEVCDGLDNDCDGSVDPDDVISACPARTNGAPIACVTGRCVYACAPGWLDLNSDLNSGDADSNGCETSCAEGMGPEICDGQDNDCDGDIDETSNTLIETCGAQAPPRALVAGCALNRCVYTCEEGWQDANDDLNDPDAATPDGCEMACRTDEEVCDGIDNDCDGDLDAEDADYEPILCPFQAGVCQGAEMLCVDGRLTTCDAARYRDHDPAYEPTESSCVDGLDNDCDDVRDGADDNCECTPANARILITSGDGDRVEALHVSASPDGSRVLVVWQTEDNRLMRLIWTEGANLTPSPSELASSGEDAAVAAGRDSWGVTWLDEDEVHVARIGQDGVESQNESFSNRPDFVTPPTVALRVGDDDVAVAWRRTGLPPQFEIAWQSEDEETSRASWDSSLETIAHLALAVQPNNTMTNWGGVLAWFVQEGTITPERFIRWRSSQGTTRERALNTSSTTAPAIAWTGQGYTLAFRDLDGSDNDSVFAVQLTQSGAESASRVISQDQDLGGFNTHNTPIARLTGPSSGTVTVAWRANGPGGSNLILRALEADLSTSGRRVVPLGNTTPDAFDVTAERIVLGFIDGEGVELILLDAEGSPLCF